MRTEREILNLVSEFAYQRSNVKIIALEGPKANENIKKDKFQDYDFAFFVSDIKCFTHKRSWLSLFGGLLFIQKPEDMELFPPDLDYGYSCMMYFKDGIKMDITLINLKDLNRYFNDSDSLVKILVDRNNLVIQEIVPDGSSYWLKKPTEDKVHIIVQKIKGHVTVLLRYSVFNHKNMLREALHDPSTFYTEQRRGSKYY